ncbi:MAG: hypothetical protein GF331_25790 [Chitinivibrionales bacterium]|nr:hypothetical protein [Chitinivibrionales bacterium]
MRHTPHDYSTPLPDGDYTVRIHFADHFGDTMGYTMEGRLCRGTSISLPLPGGLDKGVTREFAVQVSDGNGLQVECSTGGGTDVFEAALEVLGMVADGWSATHPSYPQTPPTHSRLPARRTPARHMQVAPNSPGATGCSVYRLTGQVVGTGSARKPSGVYIW